MDGRPKIQIDYERGMEKYYPINDEKNNKLYKKYLELSKNENIILCGRLAEYKYYDMSDTIESVLNIVKKLNIK